MDSIVIRNAVLEDANQILEIYSYYVKNTAITFEYDVPTLDEFQKRMKNIMKKYPYFVIEECGTIQGYAYADTFINRAAYDFSCELTVYLDRYAHKKGFGKKLYEALEKSLKEMGIKNLYACIAVTENNDEYLSNNSLDFHKHLGFDVVGTFRKCGFKFDRWYDMVWAEKIIGKHDKCSSFTYFSELKNKEKTYEI